MVEWIFDAVPTGGYFGIAFLMFAENVFPPIPSELIMPLAGFSAGEGDFHPAVVLAAGTFASLLGASPWYVLGRLLRKDRLKRLADRHGRWLTMTADDVEVADRWFDRNGARAVLLGAARADGAHADLDYRRARSHKPRRLPGVVGARNVTPKRGPGRRGIPA